MVAPDLLARVPFFSDLPIDIRVELDRRPITLGAVLAWTDNDVIPLTKAAGEALDVYIGDVPFAKAEALVLNENLGIRITAHERRQRGRFTGHPWSNGPAFRPDAHEGSRRFPSLDSLWAGAPVLLSVVVGRARVGLDRVLNLTTGAFLELDSQPAQPVELVINDRILAFGQVVVVEGNYGVRIQSISPEREHVVSDERSNSMEAESSARGVQ
ncbi:MAG TPA: FliM/FliN family flagellar motor switch protein [Bryobacteraceae bacterium]|nr:FliM/FliN family flagellar motor switch protein [Bryobacteraceae bacterium]